MLVFRSASTTIWHGALQRTAAVKVVLCFVLVLVGLPLGPFARVELAWELERWRGWQLEGRNPGHLGSGALAQIELSQSATTKVATPAMLTGFVTCAGKPLPGATLHAEHLGTGQLYVTVSDEDGRYAVPIAAAGKYAVRAELPGFAGDIQQVEILEGANSTRLDLTLHIASAATAPPAAEAMSRTG